jgi:uncharacterized membrane protein
VTYEEVVADVVEVVEATGAAIMIIGGIAAFAYWVLQLVRDEDGRYQMLRRNLGRSILLGLEVLIIGDIIRTIIVEPTHESVGVLAAIVLIRIVLSFSLEVEIDGAWPWRRAPRKT